MKKCFAFAFVFFFFTFAACTQKSSNSIDASKLPVAIVEKFVQLSAGAKSLSDRKTLQELSIGELKRAFERMTDKDFEAHYLGEKITLENLSVTLSEISGTRARVRYTVAVKNAQGSETTQEINEREVILSSSRGAWFIESVHPVGSDKVAFTKGMIL